MRKTDFERWLYKGCIYLVERDYDAGESILVGIYPISKKKKKCQIYDLDEIYNRGKFLEAGKFEL